MDALDQGHTKGMLMNKIIGLIRYCLLRTEMRKCIRDLDRVVPNLHRWE